MKRLFPTLIVLCSFHFTLNAQNVAINTTGTAANASAMLDVSSTNTGILVPRLALTATNSASPVSSPVASLLVYNTATAGAGTTAVTPGYYYWDGTQWLRVLNSGNAWQTGGNAGTTPSTNFAGTTDAQDFAIRTNNVEKMRITSAGNAGVGTTTPTERLDVAGNIKFSGALMPNNLSGSTGQIITSNGAGTAPTWSPFYMGNMGATTQIAKYFSALSWTGNWTNGSLLTFIITDPDCTVSSSIHVSIDGPWNSLFSGITIRNVESEAGQFRVSVVNNTGFTLTSGGAIAIAYIAFY